MSRLVCRSNNCRYSGWGVSYVQQHGNQRKIFLMPSSTSLNKALCHVLPIKCHLQEWVRQCTPFLFTKPNPIHICM